jgi:hypothetical protein
MSNENGLSNAVRHFRLHLTGTAFFVARIKVKYCPPTSTEGGNITWDTKEDNWKLTKELTDNICCRAEASVDLKTANIPDYSQVKLKAIVKGGTDRTSNETYMYLGSSGGLASWDISGGTLNAKFKNNKYTP